MLKNNKLVAFRLESENKFAALFYGMIDGNTLYYYQSAVNHESKLSPAGVVMHMIALDIARKNNLAFYDLMKGSHNSYKSRYIESEVQMYSASISKLKYKYLIDFLIYSRK
jgi:CelD/BcsL family acetyltransferase involved in cellulose biosynthesis